MNKLKIGVIGYGHSAKSFLVDLGSLDDVDLYVYSDRDISTQYVKDNAGNQAQFTHIKDKSQTQDMDVVIFTYPSDVIETTYAEFYPHINKCGMILMSPGQIDFSKITVTDNLVSMLPMPYNCRTVSNGQVDVLYRKQNLLTFGGNSITDELLNLLFIQGMSLNVLITKSRDIELVNSIPINSILHTARLYQFIMDSNDHSLRASESEFYNFNQYTIDLILEMSKESSIIHDSHPEGIVYGHGSDFEYIGDLTSFLKTFVYGYTGSDVDFYNTHPAYKNIGFPVDYNGNWDTKSRYFTEDVPALSLLMHKVSSLGGTTNTMSKVHKLLNSIIQS